MSVRTASRPSALVLPALAILGIAVFYNGTIGYLLAAVLPALFFFLNQKQAPTLSTTEWRLFPLIKKEQLSSNTALYRFGLPNKESSLKLPIGQHISLSANIDGKEVMRSYTPTTLDDTTGHFDLVVKTYPTGLMSRHLDQMKIGESIKVRGPKGQMKYVPNMVKNLGMIAGGTGITPMWQMVQAILRNPADKTNISVLYANNTAEDILLKKELDECAKKYPDRFKIHYILLEAPKGFNGSTGYITQDMIKEKIAGPDQDSKVLLCGPPPMVKIMTGYCEALGFAKANALSKAQDQIFKF